MTIFDRVPQRVSDNPLTAIAVIWLLCLTAILATILLLGGTTVTVTDTPSAPIERISPAPPTHTPGHLAVTITLTAPQDADLLVDLSDETGELIIGEIVSPPDNTVTFSVSTPGTYHITVYTADGTQLTTATFRIEYTTAI